MNRFWRLLLITIVAAVMPETMLADINVAPYMFSWRYKIMILGSIVYSTSDGWAPGTYKLHLQLKDGWAGPDCVLSIKLGSTTVYQDSPGMWWSGGDFEFQVP